MSTLTHEQLEQLRTDGFTTVPQLVGSEVVDELRAAYDDVLSGAAPARGDRMLGGITRQVKAAHLAHPLFADNAALRAACAIGEQVIGRPAGRAFDMLIFKGPGHPHPTPWHQDIGYFALPVAPAGTPAFLDDLQVWIALDDVDEDNGCMQFVPGRHTLPSLPHEVVSGDPTDEGRLIGIVEPESHLDLSTAVPCPLRAGGCTIHLPSTPHFTGPNRSTDRPRRAYIVNVAPSAFASRVDALERDRWGAP